MTLIIPPDYANIQMHWTSPNFFKGAALTQFGVRLAEGTLSEAAVSVSTAWLDNLQDLTSSNVTLDRVVAQTENTQSVALVGEAGNEDQTQAEPSIAVLTKKVTNVRGPRGKGRSYWPGLAYEGTYDEQGLMSDGDRSTYQGVFSSFVAAVEASVGGMVLLQNEEGQSAPIAPPPPINGLLVDPRAATQRRRLRS